MLLLTTKELAGCFYNPLPTITRKAYFMIIDFFISLYPRLYISSIIYFLGAWNTLLENNSEILPLINHSSVHYLIIFFSISRGVFFSGPGL